MAKKEENDDAARRERIAELGRDQSRRAGVEYQEVDLTAAEPAPEAPVPEEVESLAEALDKPDKE